MACWIEGDGGRISLGDAGVPLRRGVEAADAVLLLLFFFLLKGRKNDQSDSNWTDSNSDESAEWSSSAPSRI